MDTGVDASHPDLAANVWTNAGETGLDGNGADKRTNGVDDDGNGFVDCKDPACFGDKACAVPGKEICNNNIFPGGMLTMAIIEAK